MATVGPHTPDRPDMRSSSGRYRRSRDRTDRRLWRPGCHPSTATIGHCWCSRSRGRCAPGRPAGHRPAPVPGRSGLRRRGLGPGPAQQRALRSAGSWPGRSAHREALRPGSRPRRRPALVLVPGLRGHRRRAAPAPPAGRPSHSCSTWHVRLGAGGRDTNGPGLVRQRSAGGRGTGRDAEVQPAVAAMLIAVLRLIPDGDDPWRIVASFMDAVPSGRPPGAVPPGPRRGGRPVRQGGLPLRPARSGPDAPAYRGELARFPGGVEIAGCGLVRMRQWRPEASDPVALSSGCAVVARKP